MNRPLLILLILIVWAQYTTAQKALPHAKYGYTAQVGRELPRTHTLSYNSEEASVESKSEDALYIQTLNEGWASDDKIGGASKVFSRGFTMPFAWIDRQVFLYVGATKGAYEVVVNGQMAGYNMSNRTAAEFDLTSYTVEGANRLEIRTYAYNPLADEQRVDITEAIMGEIHIVAQPKVRIRDYVASVGFAGADATVQLGVILKTHLLNKKEVRLYYKLLSPTGEEVALGHRDVEIDKRREDTVRFLLNLPNARPWSHETPELYTLLLKTQHEGRFTEYISYKLGLRTIEMQGGELLINSFKLPLSVVEYTMHAESSQTLQKLTNLKEQGYNCVKISDFPQPHFFYEICNGLGIYVCNQADINTSRYGTSRTKEGNPSNDPLWRSAYVDRAVTMYHTSRNNPSAILFSTAINSANGYNLYESYMAIKMVEKNAPVIYLDAAGEWNSDAVTSSMRMADPVAAGGRMAFDITKNSDGNPKALHEIVATDASQGIYRISNNALVTTLRDDVVYSVRQGSKVVSSGRIPLSLEPQGSIEVTIPKGSAQAGKKLKYSVEIEPRR